MSTRQQRRQSRRLHTQESVDPHPSPVKPALTSGLGETCAELAQLAAEHYAHFHPRNPEERFQVDNLIRNEWFLRRYFRVESHLWEYHAMLAPPSACRLGEAFSKASPIFMRLHRRITAAEKSHKEAMAELKRLQQLPQPEETKLETQQLGSFLTTPPEPRKPGGTDDRFLPSVVSALDNSQQPPLD